MNSIEPGFLLIALLVGAATLTVAVALLFSRREEKREKQADAQRKRDLFKRWTDR